MTDQIIRVSVNTTAVRKFMLIARKDQIPYATATALNAVTLSAQKAQRAHMKTAFHVRRASWVEKSVKINHFAKKKEGKNFTEIGIISPGGGNRSDILAKFEKGGIKTPRGHSIAIPDEAKRGKTDIVTKGQRPKSFEFKLRGTGPKATVFTGEKGTFLIRKPDGSGEIWQRIGRPHKFTRTRDKSGRFNGIKTSRRYRGRTTRRLFVLTPRARIDNRLDFHDTVSGVVLSEWNAEFRKAWAKAISTAGAKHDSLSYFKK